MKTKMKAVHSF